MSQYTWHAPRPAFAGRRVRPTCRAYPPGIREGAHRLPECPSCIRSVPWIVGCGKKNKAAALTAQCVTSVAYPAALCPTDIAAHVAYIAAQYMALRHTARPLLDMPTAQLNSPLCYAIAERTGDAYGELISDFQLAVARLNEVLCGFPQFPAALPPPLEGASGP